MRKLVPVSLLAIALLLVPAAPSQAWRGHHGVHVHHSVHPSVFIGVGPAFWWGPAYPYWWYYPPPPYYVYDPPTVVVQEPLVYVQQPAPPPAPSPQSHWYYCPNAGAYYPSVQTCPEAWIKVSPRPQ